MEIETEDNRQCMEIKVDIIIQMLDKKYNTMV